MAIRSHSSSQRSRHRLALAAMGVLFLAAQLVVWPGQARAGVVTQRNYLGTWRSAPPTHGSATLPRSPLGDATAALPADPASPATPSIPATSYSIGTGGWSGSSGTSDTRGGWGDDTWTFNFKQVMKITVSVTDCCIVGDYYAVYINQTRIGTTPYEPYNGSTPSQGTFSALVGPGSHRISIQDIGGLALYKQGNSIMIPAGYDVSISVHSATAKHPVIFVHGIGQSAGDMGTNAFVPVYQQLQKVYGNGSVQSFAYVDDRSKASSSAPCPTSMYPPCASQSLVFENAKSLASQIRDLYSSQKHKVALIGYSMGAAIIRTVLAGCLIGTGATPACSDVPGKVDNVVFINGVQQGSWIMAYKEPLLDYGSTHEDPLSIVEFTIGWTAYSIAKSALGLDAFYPAESDLAPGSANIQAHDSVTPPSGIRYLNFYGDIHVGVDTFILGYDLKSSQTVSAGDLVLLPGSDAPQDATETGGARFCLKCTSHGAYQASHPDSHTSYIQWGLEDTRYFNTADLLPCLPTLGLASQMSCLVTTTTALGNITSAPEMHTNIPSTAALNSIRVTDATGIGDKTTIPTEIVRQIEAGDGIVP